MRKLPPLNAIKAFEAAARHVSFTKAAAELLVTHGAVSRQVALLEGWFGVKLFRRGPTQLRLTDAGMLYYREVTAILDRLALASMDMREQAPPTALRINAPPTFAMRWLISRLSSFQRRSPNVELRLTTSIGAITSADEGFDIGIRAGQEDLPGWRSRRFMTELIAPVCHVDLLRGRGLREVADLAGHTLVTYLTEPYAWGQWFDQAGSRMPAGQETLRFEQMYFALQAVQERMGIGLFPLFLVIDDLIARRLCMPFGALGLRKRFYNVLHRSDVGEWPVTGPFCDWLAEAGQETEEATRAWAASMGWKF